MAKYRRAQVVGGPSFRYLRSVGIGLFSALVLTACGGSTGNGGGGTVTINVMGYAFANFKDNFLSKIVQPYEASQTKVKVNYIAVQNSAAMLARLQTEKANPSVDVVIQDLTVANTGYNSGLLQPIDPAIVTNYADLDPQARFSGNKGAALTFDCLVVIYNKQKITPAPNSWLNLLDPKYKGKIASWAPPDLEGIFLLASLDKALGADYKQGPQPALDALKKAKANWLTWNPTPDTPPMILADQVTLGTDYNSDAQANAVTSNGKMGVAFPDEGLVFQINRINLVAGAKHSKEAQDFINYAIGADAQAAFDNVTLYTPTNPKAAAKMSPDVLAITAAAPALKDKIITLDWDYITANRDAWNKAFTTQILNG